MAVIAEFTAPAIANTYTGYAWEAQRVLLDMAAGQRAVSIFRTGSLPVMLKARAFAYDGDGITAEVFRSPVFTGGVPETTIFNMNDMSLEVLESQILVGVTLTSDGDRCSTPMTLIGPASAQGAGSTLSFFGSNRMFRPFTDYLLAFTSKSASQDVTARLEFFEGVLNYNLIS